VRHLVSVPRSGASSSCVVGSLCPAAACKRSSVEDFPTGFHLFTQEFCVRAPGQAPALQSCLESSDSPARFRLVVISVVVSPGISALAFSAA
jgi:hypothetical protein